MKNRSRMRSELEKKAIFLAPSSLNHFRESRHRIGIEESLLLEIIIFSRVSISTISCASA